MIHKRYTYRQLIEKDRELQDKFTAKRKEMLDCCECFDCAKHHSKAAELGAISDLMSQVSDAIAEIEDAVGSVILGG
jgi:hypothetical protein